MKKDEQGETGKKNKKINFRQSFWQLSGSQLAHFKLRQSARPSGVAEKWRRGRRSRGNTSCERRGPSEGAAKMKNWRIETRA